MEGEVITPGPRHHGLQIQEGAKSLRNFGTNICGNWLLRGLRKLFRKKISAEKTGIQLLQGVSGGNNHSLENPWVETTVFIMVLLTEN